VDSSPAGIIIADAPEVRIHVVNQAALGIRGETDAPLSDIPVDLHPRNWQFFYPDGTPYEPEDLPLSRAVLRGETTRNIEVIIRRTTGEDRWVLANAAPVRNQEGKISAGVVVFADITERKRGESERREMEIQLRQAQKMEAIGMLAGGVAHDFNNLLTVIGGYTEILREQPGHERLPEYLEEIRKAHERAAELTHQLLAFGRRQILQPRNLKLCKAVHDLEGMLRRLLGEDIELVVECEEHEGTVRADPGQIDQAIMNLVVNARDAITGGGRISIRTEAVDLVEPLRTRDGTIDFGRYIVLEVADDGLGMDEQTRARIFEPFFTTKPQGHGTGLGLSTVFGIVKQSGGQIVVESELGQGTICRGPASPPGRRSSSSPRMRRWCGSTSASSSRTSDTPSWMHRTARRRCASRVRRSNPSPCCSRTWSCLG
jgi:PAS domain S-box-containing protein